MLRLRDLLPCLGATVTCAILWYFEVGSPNPAGADGKVVWAVLGVMGGIGFFGCLPMVKKL